MKYAAAAVIYNEEGKVLLAKRAPDKFPFPEHLSLPSTSYEKGEDPKEALVKAVKKKLSIDIVVEESIGMKEGMQKGRMLQLTDYNARIIDGTPTPNQTDYTEVGYFDFKETCTDLSGTGFCIQILSEKLK